MQYVCFKIKKPLLDICRRERVDGSLLHFWHLYFLRAYGRNSCTVVVRDKPALILAMVKGWKYCYFKERRNHWHTSVKGSWLAIGLRAKVVPPSTRQSVIQSFSQLFDFYFEKDNVYVKHAFKEIKELWTLKEQTRQTELIR